MNRDNVAIIDSGGANIASVLFALERAGADAVLTADPDVISRSPRVILPGVGAAAEAMRTLAARDGLVASIRGLAQPVLGICLGMQLLFTHSEEGDADMLGILEADVRRFAETPGVTIPHMGWNTVSKTGAGADHPLLDGIADESYFYFVHSYRAPVGPYTIGTCDYAGAFTAICAQGNFMGCQFHPERSGAAGARLLENFLKL
jgi:glutamine amidotransferase